MQADFAEAEGSACAAHIAAIRPTSAPIIVIGMGRSGTSMVTGMLAVMGVYLDPKVRWLPSGGERTRVPSAQQRRDGYAEATAFRLLNEAVMRRAGATFYSVDPFLRRRNDAMVRLPALAMMRLATYRSLRTGYLDRAPQYASSAWGWKDPRNSMTLPYWLRLFPQARILHVRRRPDKVVDSLMRRAREVGAAPPPAPVQLSRKIGNSLIHPVSTVRGVAGRCGLAIQKQPSLSSFMTRDYGYKLAEQYVSECITYRSYYDQYMEVDYEDILDDPYEAACTLAYFAHIAPPEQRIAQAVDLVDRPSASPKKEYSLCGAAS